MTQQDAPEAGFAVEMLLVRQVKGLVTATADLIAESTGGDPLGIEADLYKIVAASCEAAAKTAEEMAAAEDEGLAIDHSEGEGKL